MVRCPRVVRLRRASLLAGEVTVPGREIFELPRREASEDGPLFDALELAPVVFIDDEGSQEVIESLLEVPVDERDRVVWSIFGHTRGEGVRCLGDFADRDEALEVIRRLAARPT